MAATDNDDAPFGLRPCRHLSGGVIRSEEYPLVTSGANIYTNDPVLFVSGKVSLATAGVRIAGVFNGCRVVKSNGEVAYNTWYQPGQFTGAIEQTAFVYMDPNITYTIQADDDTTPLPTTGAAVNLNADVLSATGNTNTGMSAFELDASSAATGVAQLRILGLFKMPKNDWGGNEVVEVKINEHVLLVTGITGQN